MYFYFILYYVTPKWDRAWGESLIQEQHCTLASTWYQQSRVSFTCSWSYNIQAMKIIHSLQKIWSQKRMICSGRHWTSNKLLKTTIWEPCTMYVHLYMYQHIMTIHITYRILFPKPSCLKLVQLFTLVLHLKRLKQDYL